ncbi:MAG: hypothetical protein FD123_3333 [Bacteroidetes bacterium]|nr:MAG: hypothetical protein FD123_3333 [Bacteroidota bacterium]
MLNRLISVFLFLAIAVPLSAQPRNGRHKEQHPNGKTSVSGHFRKGLRSGKWEYYAENGLLLRREYYKQGKAQGWSRAFEDGKYLRTETHYTDGKRDSIYREFDRQGNVMLAGRYAGDMKQGTWTTYSSPSPDMISRKSFYIPYVRFRFVYAHKLVKGRQLTLKTENYLDGLLHGEYKQFNETFNLVVSGQYENGKRSGLFTEFSKDFTTRYERTYRNDSLVKEAEFGRKHIEYELRDGVKHGVYKEWSTYSGGHLKLQGQYVNGERHGTFQEWNRTGKKWLEYNYVNGELTGERKEFDENGWVTIHAFFKNGDYDSTYTTYYDKSLKHEEQWFCRDGKFEGTYFRWHEHVCIDKQAYQPELYPGALMGIPSLAEEGQYVNDKREGKFTGYACDGKLLYTAHYRSGTLDGLYEEYHANGKIFIRQEFKTGQLAGTLKVWEPNGKLQKEYSIAEIKSNMVDQDPVAGIRRFAARASRRPDEVTDPGDEIGLMEFPEEQPSFPGGESEMYKYLSQNIRYPAMEKEMGIQGTVYIKFIIGKDGSVSEVEVARSVPGGTGLEKEAVRVIRSMPRWSPGKTNGRPVRTKYTLPIRFILH